MIFLVIILIAPIKAVAADKSCGLGETCKVSCDYTLVIPITNEPNTTYNCHLELSSHALVTFIKLEDPAWWWDYDYVAHLSYPGITVADVLVSDQLKSSTGSIKIHPRCNAGRFKSAYVATETVICTKNNL